MALPAETAEAIKLMIAEAVGQAVSQAIAQTAAQRALGEQTASDMRKAFERMDKFDGKIENWKEWQYQFSVIMNEYNQKNGHVMELLEKMEDEIATSEDADLELEEETAWMHKTCVQSAHSADLGRSEWAGAQCGGPQRLRRLEDVVRSVQPEGAGELDGRMARCHPHQEN